MKIGISEKGYPIIRNILDKVPGAGYVLLKKNDNLFHTLSTVKNLVFRKKIDFSGKFFFYRRPDIDVLHLYNDINYSGRKWVTTFETLVPRFIETKDDHQKNDPCHTVNKKTNRAIKQIIKPNCLAIIAISDNAADIQRELFKHYSSLNDGALTKLHILHPPQKLISSATIQRGNAGHLNFIFVGNHFHRKGGEQMLEVFEKLRERYEFSLTIISSFGTDNYVTKVSRQEAQKMRDKVRKTEWIQHYENIPNEKVLQLIQQAHIGLLPTWSDTYGFSVLEMQACGVPVITTDIRALPEINNNDCGWMIHLPQNRLKQALYFNEEQKEKLKSTLKEQLESILIDIFENREQIQAKAENSLERIKKFHNPESFGEKLRKIYLQQ